MDSRRPAALLAASLGLQLFVATVPDPMGDLSIYRHWLLSFGATGLIPTYWPPDPMSELVNPQVDYPPVLPYLLTAMGHAFNALAPGWRSWTPGTLDFAIRLPFVLANIAIGLLVFRAVRRRAGPDVATAAAAVYLLSPAVVFNSAYWGQSDSLSTLAVVVGLLALGPRPVLGLVVLAAGTQLKPLVYPFLPLAALWIAKRHGLRHAVLATGAALLAWLALLLPFAAAGRLGSMLVWLYRLLDAMPFASVNAHNVWWMVGRGVPWIPAWRPLMGPLTYEHVGYALFGLFYIGTSIAVLRSSDERALFVGSAGIAFGFFELSTHMHENHLFVFLPLALLACGTHRHWRHFAIAAGLFVCLNMLLHDPGLRESWGPYTPGPRVRLAPTRALDVLSPELIATEGFDAAVAQAPGHTTLLRLAATLLNAQLGLLLFCYWVVRTRFGSSCCATAANEPSRSRTPWLGIAILGAVVGAPFVAKLIQVSSWAR